MKPIYLDHNASTPVNPEVLEAMMPYLKEHFGNASSANQFGQKTRKAIEEARVRLAEFINAEDPNEIIFTSGATESNNTAIKGTLTVSKGKGQRFVSSAIEHSSIRQVFQQLVETDSIDNVVVPVEPSGIIRVQDIDEACTPDTILVTVMSANNEIGTLQPIKEISKVCQRKNIPFLTDAVQTAGKIPINVQDLGADMLSISGHKMGAPKGVGILYVRKGTRLASLITGGKQEKVRRGGTENVAGIVGLGVAAQIAKQHMAQEVVRIKNLRDFFEKEIVKNVPSTSVNGDPLRRTCNTANICFEYTDSSQLLMALDLKGVSASSGSACASGSPEPSHVLLAIGLPQHKAHASLRFSLGVTTTEEEIKNALLIIKDTVARVRETHPLWKKAANG